MKSLIEKASKRLFLGVCVSLLGTLITLPLSAEESLANVDVVQQSTKKVFGKVVDATGMPVVGASVYQKGTTNGAITDVDGNFTLNVPKGASIVVSYIGYKTQELVINTNTNYEVVLVEDSDVF